MDLKYAVVGGGVAGAYTAWRLASSGAGPTGLFEYSDRIGGRLLSKRLPGMPNVVAELGGMRFIPDSHKLVQSIVQHLALAVEDFPMGNNAPINPKDPNGPKIGRSENLLYLRGQLMTQADLADPAKVPYKLAYQEQGLSPTQLQFKVMDMLVGDRYKTMTTEDWFKLEVFGEPIYKIGYWNLLSRMLSSEAYKFMREGGGYDANTANTNTVYQLPATEYGDDNVTYKCLKSGYQSLPLALEAEFLEYGALPTQMGQALSKIEKLGEGYRLTFKATERVEGKTIIPWDADETCVTAEHVILAMPRRSLELIDWSCFKSNPWLRENLPSVAIQKAFKLLLGFEVPWWRALGLVAGRSTTDLPVRQAYYMGSEADYSGELENQSALMLATYNDVSTVPFWRGLEHGRPFEGHKTSFTGDDAPVPESDVQVTEAMVEAARQQLAEMHGLKSIPRPYTAIYHDWSDDPYGGGWHEWQAGYKYPDIIPQMLQPVKEENVYICGEAYSTEQGWVEGSLDTAETMLQEKLGLDRPEWIEDGWKPGG